MYHSQGTDYYGQGYCTDNECNLGDANYQGKASGWNHKSFYLGAGANTLTWVTDEELRPPRTDGPAV